MDKAFTTPMMKQYMAIKKQYSDCLLFFRLGDFYELFLDDAVIGSKVLNITLTSRSRGQDGKIPLAGVPYHAVDTYLAKLVRAGYKVAICEQMTEPDKYGIVEREVVRIVTPGTLLDEATLDKKQNNYVMSLTINDEYLGIAVADISTGKFLTNQFSLGNKEQIISDELARLHPSECILSDENYNDPSLLKILSYQKGLNIFPFKEWEYFANHAEKVLKKHFSLKSLEVFDIDNKPQAVQAAGVLLGYLKHTQKDRVDHIKAIGILSSSEYMLLDRSTILNLELFSTIREHTRHGSLIYLLDQTVTAMGGRTLRDWLRKPLLRKSVVEKRHGAVAFFLKNRSKREKLRDIFQKISDIERTLSKLSVGIGNARDLANLKSSLEIVIAVKTSLKTEKNEFISKVCADITKDIEKVVPLVNEYITQEPPISIREGGMINKGVNDELDSLQFEVESSSKWLEEYEIKERKRTGIASLKVKFNEVFGFFIEISKSNLSSVPDDYMRKQTMVNGERFITKELKTKEESILTARERMKTLEYSIYLDLLQKVLTFTASIQTTASAIGELDCILNFAFIAERYQYVQPKIIETGEITVKCGRHAVVETLLDDEQFVPNDVDLNHKDHQLLVITGPNMAGKSVYIRQAAIIVLLTQIGSFVPAESALISLADRIFVRSGASDAITSGLSTFMVEMVETAQILNSCTKDSLIIMDEVGRGTSTYDGISIAWAVAEFLANNAETGPKTLFATHYHELQNLADLYPKKITNYHMAVERHENDPIFLHTLMEGAASHSYGVMVAKIAGIPEEITKRAWEILAGLEEGKQTIKLKSEMPRSNKIDKQSEEVLLDLKNLDVNRTSPIDALNKLADMKEKLTKKKVESE